MRSCSQEICFRGDQTCPVWVLLIFYHGGYLGPILRSGCQTLLDLCELFPPRFLHSSSVPAFTGGRELEGGGSISLPPEDHEGEGQAQHGREPQGRRHSDQVGHPGAGQGAQQQRRVQRQVVPGQVGRPVPLGDLFQQIVGQRASQQRPAQPAGRRGDTLISYPYVSGDPLFGSLSSALSRVPPVEVLFSPFPPHCDDLLLSLIHI